MAVANTPWAEHGKLRVCENGHYLEHEDGTGFFCLADTAWRLTSLAPDDLTRYLENRKSLAFNTVMFKAIEWQRSNPDAVPPFEGSGSPFAAMKPVPGYWDTVDEIVDSRLKEKMQRLRSLVEGDLPTSVPGYWGFESEEEAERDFRLVEEHIRKIGLQQ